MRAMDVMVRDVVTASPNENVDQVIELLAKHDASTLPVVDAEGNVVGMIGDLDLMRRPEIGTEKHHPWWMEAMTRPARRPRNLPNRTAGAWVKSCPHT